MKCNAHDKTITRAMASHMSPARFLKLMGACESSVEWARAYRTSAEAWDACPRADWLLWLLEIAGIQECSKARQFGCRCVRSTPLPAGGTVWDLLSESASRGAVEVGERYACGDCDEEDLSTALEAASWVASTLWTVGPAQARAAAAAAAWTAAPQSAAEYVAHMAAEAANRSEPAIRAQADAVRAIFGNPAIIYAESDAEICFPNQVQLVGVVRRTIFFFDPSHRSLATGMR